MKMKRKILKLSLILKTIKIINKMIKLTKINILKPKKKKIQMIKKTKIINMVVSKSKLTLKNNYQKNNHKEIR